ncbi:MAG TPA: OmpA family protein [Saprospiraceae bacterium]|nr:OmpA family protein [Saprospiraceae bacterium]HMQ85199.1 OmpA family protein [Saprospiraceae bacterium]
MRKMTWMGCLLLFLVAGQDLSAQNTKVKRAERLMEAGDYQSAITMLHQIIDKEPSDEAKAALGAAYRSVGNIENAAQWYGQLASMPNANPEFQYIYGTLLFQLDNCEAAEHWFKQYLKLRPYDPRKKDLLNACQRKSELEKKSFSQVSLSLPTFNGPANDLGPVYYKNGLVFTAFRPDLVAAKENGRFYSLFYVEVGEQNGVKNYGTVTPFSKELNSPFHDAVVSFNQDQTEIFMTRTRQMKVNQVENPIRRLEITHATQIPQVGWSEAAPLPINSDDYSVAHPYLSPDGEQLFFSSDMPGGFGGSDIYVIVRKEGQWGSSVNLGPNVNTEGDEVRPFISTSGALYFASNGHFGLGGQDIFFCQMTKDSIWGTAENLGAPFNTAHDDYGLILNSNGEEGYFTSNRPGGMGGDDIYFFQRKGQLAAIEVIDLEKTINIPYAYVVNSCTGDTLQTDAGGNCALYLHECCTLTGYINGYLSRSMEVCPEEQTGDTLYLVLALKPELIVEEKPEELVVETVKEQPKPQDIIPLDTNFKPVKLPEPDLGEEKFEITRYDDGKGGEEIAYILNIYYDSERASVRSDAFPELERLLKILYENSNLIVEISSHTDANGPEQYNRKLSQRRADNVVAWLVYKGIDRNRLVAKGYGEGKLVNRCRDGVDCSESEHQMNRRTEFKVIGEVH